MEEWKYYVGIVTKYEHYCFIMTNLVFMTLPQSTQKGKNEIKVTQLKFGA